MQNICLAPNPVIVSFRIIFIRCNRIIYYFYFWSDQRLRKDRRTPLTPRRISACGFRTGLEILIQSYPEDYFATQIPSFGHLVSLMILIHSRQQKVKQTLPMDMVFCANWMFTEIIVSFIIETTALVTTYVVFNKFRVKSVGIIQEIKIKTFCVNKTSVYTYTIITR